MLKPSCERFRSEESLDLRHPHALECTSCQAFAERLDLSAARLGLPLSLEFRQSLLDLPESVRCGELVEARDPLESMPLPPGLEKRLLQIPRRENSQPPVWIRSARYAVAASYIATVITGAAFGNPAELGKNVVSTVTREAGAMVQRVGTRGRTLGTDLEQTATTGYQTGKETVLSSTRWLTTSVGSIVDGLWPMDANADTPTTDDPVDPSVDETKRSTP